MENKYYVPDLEEFHVGFEYERYDFQKNEWIKQQPKTLDELLDCPDGLALEGYIEAEKVRCKFLDRQDIEELGWEFYVSDDYDCYYSKDKVWRLEHYFNDDDLAVQIFSEKGTKDNRFQGTIRNKSDLARLMKMLNIE